MAWGPFKAGGGGGSSGGTAADISMTTVSPASRRRMYRKPLMRLSVLTLTIQAVPAQSGNLT